MTTTTSTRSIGAQPTAMGTLLQEQILVNEISVEYSCSSARTIFAIPTVLTVTTTQTGTVEPYVAYGETITPPATTTITNTIDAQATPVDASTEDALTGTLSLVSVLIAGATVTVSAQTFTYYTPVIGSAGTAETVSQVYTTEFEDPTAAITSLATQAVLSKSHGALLQNAPTVATSTSTAASSTASSEPEQTSSSPSVAQVTGIPETQTSTSDVQNQTESSTPSATAISESSQSDFVSTVLTAMNTYRALHDAPALTWNYTLSAAALAYAETCVFEPSDAGNYGEGETLAAGTSTEPTFYIDLWYDEGSNYDYSNPGFSDSTGHFTQLVWANTSSVGCGFSSGCNEYPNYLVCRYEAPGNVVGGTNNDQFFIQNVLAL